MTPFCLVFRFKNLSNPKYQNIVDAKIHSRLSNYLVEVLFSFEGFLSTLMLIIFSERGSAGPRFKLHRRDKLLITRVLR